MTWQEKNELEKLRVDIKKYREFEQSDKQSNQAVNKSFEESDEEEVIIIKFFLNNLK